MYDVHECQVCHTIKDGPDELCKPEPKLDICSPQVDRGESRKAQCESVAAKAGHYCAGCGRLSSEPEQLCIPQRTD